MAVLPLLSSTSALRPLHSVPLSPVASLRPAKLPFLKKSLESLSLSVGDSYSSSLMRGASNSCTLSNVCQRFQSLTIYAAKGYKMKSHKASAKRYRVTGSGKIMRRRAGKQHLLAKKNTKRKLRLSKMVQVNRSDYDNVIGALPYLKVNRKAQ